MRAQIALTLAVLAFLGCNERKEKAASTDGELAAKAFADYKAAIVSKDGARAAALLDAQTIAFYDRARSLTLQSSDAELKREGVVMQILVRRLRSQVGAQKVRAMTGKQIIAYGVDAGWIGANVRDVTIGEATVTGDRAEAPGRVAGRTVPFVWQLRRENGAWKLILTSLFPLAEAAIETAAKRSGMSVEQLIEAAASKR